MITDSALLKNCTWIILQWNINRMLPFHCCFVYQHVLIKLQWYQIRWQQEFVATGNQGSELWEWYYSPSLPLTASTDLSTGDLILCYQVWIVLFWDWSGWKLLGMSEEHGKLDLGLPSLHSGFTWSDKWESLPLFSPARFLAHMKVKQQDTYVSPKSSKEHATE